MSNSHSIDIHHGEHLRAAKKLQSHEEKLTTKTSLLESLPRLEEKFIEKLLTGMPEEEEKKEV